MSKKLTELTFTNLKGFHKYVKITESNRTKTLAEIAETVRIEPNANFYYNFKKINPNSKLEFDSESVEIVFDSGELYHSGSFDDIVKDRDKLINFARSLLGGDFYHDEYEYIKDITENSDDPKCQKIKEGLREIYEGNEILSKEFKCNYLEKVSFYLYCLNELTKAGFKAEDIKTFIDKENINSVANSIVSYLEEKKRTEDMETERKK